MPRIRTRSLSDAISDFLLDRQIEGRSPYTIHFYRQFLRQLRVFVGGESPIESLTVATLRRYLAATNDGHPDAHRCRYTALRAFFNWAKKQNYILYSPLTVSAPKLPESVIPVFTDKEIQTMLQCCNTGFALRDKAVILTLYDTGMRVGELANMRLDDIDIDGRLITVRGKGKKQRVLKISTPTLKAVWAYLKTRKSPRQEVWLTEEGRPLTVSGLQQIVERIVKRTGITGRKAGPHTFRHTFACDFLEAGGDSLDLQYLLGHSSLKMVERYSRATKARRALKAHERFSPVDRLGLI